VNGITLTGTVTSSGNLTLGGTLSGVSLTTQVSGTLPVANGGTGVTTSTGTSKNVLSSLPSFDTTIGVGAATASASGSGITFPATQSASSDANTLDDYEEGTWTPSIGGTATYTNQIGRYTKIGNMVYCTFRLTILARGTGSLNSFSGLPFTTANISNMAFAGCLSYFDSDTASTFIAYNPGSNSTTIGFNNTTAAQNAMTNNPVIFGLTRGDLIGTLTYMTS
jgi:hypothetical protein